MINSTMHMIRIILAFKQKEQTKKDKGRKTIKTKQKTTTCI